jgi:hypothetical protein
MVTARCGYRLRVGAPPLRASRRRGSSLAAFPLYLGYFELAGGTRGGPRHLLNSNIDWGQRRANAERWEGQTRLRVALGSATVRP